MRLTFSAGVSSVLWRAGTGEGAPRSNASPSIGTGVGGAVRVGEPTAQGCALFLQRRGEVQKFSIDEDTSHAPGEGEEGSLLVVVAKLWWEGAQNEGGTQVQRTGRKQREVCY